MVARNASCSAGIAFGLVAGVLYAGAYPPFEWAPLGWLALVPLFVACLRLPPLGAAAAGLAFGLAGTLAAGWWLPGMLERYFEVARPAAWASVVGLGLLDGVPYAALGAGAAWAARRGRAPGGLVLGAGFVLAEWLRANGPVANPYALLAYSQSGTAFAQLVDVTGPYGLGWLLASANAALAALLVEPAGRRRLALRPFAAALALAALAFAYGGVRLAEPTDPAALVRVAVVQTGIARERHGNEALRHERLEQTLALTREAAAAAPDLVFWPEHAVDFTLDFETPERRALFRAVDALGVDLVLGAARPGLGDTWHNSVYLVGPRGHVAHSDKVRLVPFAEYGPFGPALRAGTAVFAPGAPAPLAARAASVGAFVCGESLHPEVARGLVRDGADLLANPSIDTWLREPAAARALLQITAFRAIETRRAIVRATPTGYSAVIDPWGRISALSRFGGPDVLVAEVPRSTRRTLYQQSGDAACLLALAAVAAHPLGAGLRRRRRDAA
jgi:apolipoprotein N-acyltransferase